MWDIKFRKGSKTKFEQLIEYITTAIDEGELKEGDPIPTHRELSKKLDLSIGTITKVFNELDKLGYISGEIGRGTYVKDITSEYNVFKYNEEKLDVQNNLGHFRTTELFNHAIQQALNTSIRTVTNSRSLFNDLDDLHNTGSAAQKEAILLWLHKIGLQKASVDNILLCSSATQSISFALECFTNTNDGVIIEVLGNGIYRDHILHCKRQVITVEIDDQGIIPESLLKVVKQRNTKLLLTNPTLQNPTTYITGKKRKEELAQIIITHNIIVVEVGILDSFLNKKNTTYYDLIPNNAVYITSFSKIINPAIKVGAIVCNGDFYKKLEMAIKISYWANSSLLNNIVLDLITSGNAEIIQNNKIKLANARQKYFKQTFDKYAFKAHPNGFHVWFKLPHPWKSSEITQIAYNEKILIRNSELFYFSQEGLPPYIRISLACITDMNVLKSSLDKLKYIIDNYSHFSIRN